MSDTTPKPISFSAYWTDKLGEEIKKRAIEQCPDGYEISTSNAKTFEAIRDAWNLGIDSHVEAITERSSCNVRAEGSRRMSRCVADIIIHPEELHVLVRRLMESGDERAEDLASSICSTLEIELI